jgi:hypothetical protein
MYNIFSNISMYLFLALYGSGFTVQFEKILIGFLYFTETIRFKLSVTVYLFLACMDLQPYGHDCFSKISRVLFDFQNNTYWVSLFYRETTC